MKLHEEFKEYETLWEATEVSMVESSSNQKAALLRAKEIRAEIAKLQQELQSLNLEEIETSSVVANVPGTTKKLECNGVLSAEALDALLTFINGLTQEEKLNLYFYWSTDDYEIGDGEGNLILNKDSGELEVIDNTWSEDVPEDTYDRVVATLGIN